MTILCAQKITDAEQDILQILSM